MMSECSVICRDISHSPPASAQEYHSPAVNLRGTTMRNLLVAVIVCAAIAASGQEPQTAPAAPQTRPEQPSPSASVKTNPPAPQPQSTERKTSEPKTQPIDLIWGLKIPMRDGVQLNGTVYK